MLEWSSVVARCCADWSITFVKPLDPRAEEPPSRSRPSVSIPTRFVPLPLTHASDVSVAARGSKRKRNMGDRVTGSQGVRERSRTGISWRNSDCLSIP